MERFISKSPADTENIGKMVGGIALLCCYKTHLITQLSVGASNEDIFQLVVLCHSGLFFHIQFAFAFLIIIV